MKTRNPLTLRVREPLSITPEDEHRRDDLEHRLDAAKARMGSQYLLHNYNPTVRVARAPAAD